MSLEYWLLYVFTLTITTIIPGPSVLLCLVTGARYGSVRAIATVMGIVIASVIQASIALAGLGTLLAASAPLFTIIKWCGAAYLVYVGFCLLRAPALGPIDASAGDVPDSSMKLFRQGFMVAIGNPKAIVFFTSFFPQFIDPASGGPLHYGFMLLAVAGVAFFGDLAYAFGGQTIARTFNIPVIRRHLNKAVGGTLIFAGIGLAASGNK